MKEENLKLLETNQRIVRDVESLEVQVEDLRGITGLLDGTEQDLRDVETKLRAIHQGIRSENMKHQNNNLVSLFTLVDKDNDGELTQEEVTRLHEFVVTVYGRDVDFSSLDRDGDARLSLPEFIKRFNA